MREKVEAVLAKMGYSLLGNFITLVDVKEREGIVKVELFVPSSDEAVSEEMALELLEEKLQKTVPGVKKVVGV